MWNHLLFFFYFNLHLYICIFPFPIEKFKQKQHWNVCDITYFIFALVTPTERALHGVAALYSDFSPHDNTCRWLFRTLNDKAAAAHAEGWSDLGQDLRKSLENTGKHSGWVEILIYLQNKAWLCKSVRLCVCVPYIHVPPASQRTKHWY